MSDDAGTPEQAAAPAAPEWVAPMSPEFLPPNMRKHVDPKAPAMIRMMGAKAMVPGLAPADLLGMLFMLTFDPDAPVREQATKTAQTLPDRMLAGALRDESVKSPVLGWFLDLHWESDSYAEMLILNASTPDEAVAKASRHCGLRTAEIIGQNQLRILRHDEIIRQLCQNGNATPALIDSVCDFAVRSGLNLPDVQQIQDARVRLFGPQVLEKPPDPGPTADQLMEEFHIGEDGSAPLEEGKRLTLSQKVMKMNVAEKIKLATKGNKEARGLLIRDTNRLVSVAVIRSPKITDGEILVQAMNKTASEDVLRIIYGDREWTKAYTIKLALVKNPKVPQAIAMRFLNTLRESDVKGLARDKNVPNIIQMMAKKMIEKKEAPKKHDK